MPTTPATQSELFTLLVDSNAQAMRDLLVPEGFTPYGPNLQHDTTGVMVAVGADGYRITFVSAGTCGQLGVVDLPPSTGYTAVRDTALALHRFVAAEIEAAG
ncbi:hypothetical protein BDK92_7186 [Micromonospora pisi]|uniref:Uncharacterized protein n=1 Tax=Micromonospora pisi TaxID=589240 RepID=A0A495JVV1_9ACTN|nr:hypothetical protein [Micromonospora pisi]RKR92708.1 hypothetical protein BDK92_7186 [Micromonospora pisi]